MYENRRSSWDMRDRKKIKPTLYFTEKELEQLDEFRADRSYSSGSSKAAYIEDAVRDKLGRDFAARQAKEEEAKKAADLEKKKAKALKSKKAKKKTKKKAKKKRKK